MDWLIELLMATAVAFGGSGGGEPFEAPEVEGSDEVTTEEVTTEQADLAGLAEQIVAHLQSVMGIASEDAEEGLTTAQDAVTNGLNQAQSALEQAAEAAGQGGDGEDTDADGGPPFEPPVPSEVGPAGGIPGPGGP